MSTAGGKLTEIFGREFRIVDSGLDEAEVRAFIAALVDEIDDLASKLEYYLNSLTKLGEKTVIEAEQLAKSIRIEARRAANAKAATILRRAEEKGNQIVEEAKKRAKPEARKMVSRAEQRGRQIVEEAGKKAEREANKRLAAAEQKARQIMKQAYQKAEKAKGTAEEEASRILLEAKKRTKEDSLLIRQEGVAAASTEEDNRAPEAFGTEDAVCLQVDTTAQSLQVQMPPGYEEGGEASLGLYHGMVELAIRPPAHFNQVLNLYRHLTKTPQIKLVDVKGSDDEGIIVKLLLQTHIPLLRVLEALPEVDIVSEAVVEDDGAYPQTGDEPPVRRIVVTTKR